MKKITILLAGISLLIFHQLTIASTGSDNPKEATSIQTAAAGLKISSTPELAGLAHNWVESYTTSNHAHQVSLGVINSKAESIENLSLISDGNSPIVANPVYWKMVVGRDVIIPIVSKNNPMLKQIQETGVSTVKFAALLKDPANRAWNVLLSNVQPTPLTLYMTSDDNIQNGLMEFAATSINTRDTKICMSATEMIKAVSADKFAIGFCKLNDLRAYNSAAVTNVVLLPIDKNGNGRIDNFENIYTSLDDFIHGVWVGKYPKSLSSNIYAVSTAKPETEAEIAFLAWIMANGQQLLISNGYCDLATTEKNSNLASLLGTSAVEFKEVATASGPSTWPIVLTITVILGIFLVIFFYSRKRVVTAEPGRKIEIAPMLIEQVVNVPKGLYFDKSHTWAFMEQDGSVRVGIDDFLQHITGKLTRIKMKETGEKVRKGETIMTIIQDGKQLNIYAPISGTILSHNELLLNDTAVINDSPFFKGWVYQIEPTNWLREAQFMLMGEKYMEWLKDEFVRLKDFIASSVKTNELVYSHVILQDGGELTDNVLAHLEPKIWEDFQTQFIDTSR